MSEHIDRSVENESLEAEDEILRLKHFICDWYSEISELNGKNFKVYHNEIRTTGTVLYTLTESPDRMRAVYPRGERFFKLEYTNSLEFSEQDGVIRCQVNYGNDYRYSFPVKAY